jgi:hypothetical protein
MELLYRCVEWRVSLWASLCSGICNCCPSVASWQCHVSILGLSNLLSFHGYSEWLLVGRPCRVKNLLLFTSPWLVLGPTEPPIQYVFGVKRPEREADHSSPTSAEVKKMWLYISTSPYVFMAYCLIIYVKDNVILLLYTYIHEVPGKTNRLLILIRRV